jgi:hypothetical protein
VERHARTRGLSAGSRAITAGVAVLSGVLGAILFLAPGWAAPRFAWNVSELVVMSIGAWFVGNTIWAARIVRDWHWALHASGLVYLWCFGAFELVVLLAYRSNVRADHLVAWLYLVTIALLTVAAIIGVVDVVRLRPPAEMPGRPMPAVLRILVVLFVVFVTFLFAVAMLRPAAAVGGGVFPEDMSAFTVRSFGVYFLALVLAAIVVARRSTIEPLLAHIVGGIGITIPILLASLLHLDVFDLADHPGQWIYLGSYVVVLVTSLVVLVYFRSPRKADTVPTRRPQ